MKQAKESASARNLAARARPGISDRLAAWRDSHLYSLLSSLGRLAQRPWATLLTSGVMAVAMMLPLCLALLLGNAERLSGTVQEARELGVFLRPDVPAADVARVAERVRQLPGVDSVEVRTPEAGLREFREMADFAGALDLLDYNPLPAVLVVTPHDGIDEARLPDTLRDLPEADFVQHDAEWRARLASWLAFGRRLTLLTAGLLGLGVLLVVGNTVRLDIQGRSEEIQTVQLLGASDGFVRRPFLYLGAWYGVLAALFAVIGALVARWALQSPVSALVENYGSSFTLQGLQFHDVLAVFAASMFLGWLGAWLAAGHHLRQTLPRGNA